ncbi:MAG TPA: MFS transporter, partial [Terriglobia bacterium]|nr:MFS transporter [Terriglobia bacterium]
MSAAFFAMNTIPSRGSPAGSNARSAMSLLLLINLFNYIDRQVLAAVVPDIRESFFGAGTGAATSALLDWFESSLGFKPENALIGLLSMAFMVTYMLCAPVFGRLAETRSRWTLIGIGVALWSLASGATGLAGSFGVLLVTRCLVGVGEAAYGPIAPTLISDFYPAERRGRALAWFYLAIPFGSALGFILGEQIGDAFGWRSAFFAVVPPGLALGAWALRKKEPARGQADAAGPTPARHVHWRDYLI